MGNDPDVMWVTGHIGVVLWQTSSNLTQGVGISRPLAIVVAGHREVGSIDTGSRLETIACVISQTTVDLAIGPGLSLSLANVVTYSVSKSTISSDQTMTIVHTSDDATIGVSMIHLTQGVGIAGDHAGSSDKLKCSQ